MEKASFRDNMERLNSLYPGRVTISQPEAAKVLGCDIRVVRAAIAKRVNPLPTLILGKRRVIPIAPFARWLS